MPAAAHPGDAGMDLVTTHDAIIHPGERVLLPTGVAIALPAGYMASVVPRSGLGRQAWRESGQCAGHDRCWVPRRDRVSVINLDPREAVTLRRGDDIAQMIVQQVPVVRLHEVQLPGSDRGLGGFGSTGTGPMEGHQE